MSTSIYNLPHRHFWVPFAVSQWFPFVQHIRQGKQDGYPTNLDRLTYFQTHGELHKGPCTFSLPGTNNLPRHLCTPAATSYLRFIMDAQRPWPHFVQLNGLPDQMPEVAKDRERIEVHISSLFQIFCRGSRELHMGRELGSSRPSHRWVLPLLLNSGCHTGRFYPWVFYTCFTR